MKRFKSIALKCLVVLAVALLFPLLAYATGQAISGNISFAATFNEITSNNISPVEIQQGVAQNLQYGTGTGSGQVDTFYAAKLTLSGATTTLDLTTLMDPAGNAINFARVREFIVQNTAGTAGFDVKVLASSSNGWPVLPPSANPIYCRYGAVLRFSDPTSTGSGNGNVVGGTTKSITFDPGANTVVIYVLIVGGSAA